MTRVLWALLFAALLQAAPATGQTTSALLLAIIRGDPMGPVLAFIDPAAARILDRVPLGADPHVAAISADGKTAYVVNTNDALRTPDADSLSVIDLVARKEIRRVPTGDGSEPHDVRIVGGKLYLALEGYKAIARYDPARNKFEWTIGLGQKGPHMLAVSADGNTIIGTNPESNTVSIVTNVLKGPINSEVVQVAGGNEPEGIEISPDGKEAWVSDQAAGGISVIDVTKKALTQHVDLKTTHATRLRLMPDGRRLLLVDRHTAELVVVDATSRAVLKKISMPDTVTVSARNRNRIYDVTVTPDGSRAYVSVNSAPGRAYIGVVDMKTLEVMTRIETGAMADGMAWVVMK